ncbi:hypothetical protein GLOIN_2v1868960 [Rhizophagus irregularis DAOM 181602=DAOM 197198]|uniref:Uncharacterized protein n=1 Tax=Rhizophagus irregularis (strain DAOM 181602 / DAOM 197198 / MUCL 43194) TaxID=747089 RepID=A0A2P4QSC4_RHIID|nr:hypothetical protein GLOIN_2v1868960 [Rhizophagus irregularis DAOM 181602=DAOM 197198]POG80556.1 hypothetical protein GLOIN_2v1868960 [Rhizophagus irregularis DAOM 181602=DAOM 197198]|eukprot:XP_025187422.1 hypothetical protein GLOIN_2v1868960 [Rhizophagus irregularis DAOM 181602=DAOM 197198]
MLGSDSFLFVGCFSFVASESSFIVDQTFWSSLSFFVGMLTFGDLDDCRWGFCFQSFFFVLLGCLTPNEPELIDNLGAIGGFNKE